MFAIYEDTKMANTEILISFIQTQGAEPDILPPCIEHGFRSRYEVQAALLLHLSATAHFALILLATPRSAGRIRAAWQWSFGSKLG